MDAVVVDPDGSGEVSNHFPTQSVNVQSTSTMFLV